MTGRLAAISSLIEPARVIADVGCDHGLIAEYCVKNGVCERVIASDISATCLNKAKSKLAAYKNVTFMVCDGIEYECDEAIIAGMGGLLISAILEKAAVLPQTLVLCPHRDADIVRRTLIRLRYSIDGDIIAEERGKIYFIIRARRDGGAQALDELQYLFGVNYRCENDLLKAYLQKLYDICMLAPDKNADRLASVLAAMTAQGMRLHDQFVHKGAKMEDSLKKKFQTLLEYQKKDIELRKLNSILERDQALASMTKHKRIFNEAKQTINDC